MKAVREMKEGKGMHLVPTKDFEAVKRKYLEVIENTPGIHEHALWEYGKHPTDESLKAYMDQGEMYVLLDGEEIAGMTAISMSQGDDYDGVGWQEELRKDQVAVLHLLAVCPAYRGRTLGRVILDEALEIAREKGKRALRLDTLKTNTPAQKMYERYGFSMRGEKRQYAENTGVTDFMFYEMMLD